jgi:prevent-host-death family protein
MGETDAATRRRSRPPLAFALTTALVRTYLPSLTRCFPMPHPKLQNRPGWQLQEAKARLSEIVKLAQDHGPQLITLRGEPAAVLLSAAEYARLTSSKRSIVDDILDGAPWPDDLVDAVNNRPRDTGRPVDL